MKGPGFGHISHRINSVMDKNTQLGLSEPFLHHNLISSGFLIFPADSKPDGRARIYFRQQQRDSCMEKDILLFTVICLFSLITVQLTYSSLIRYLVNSANLQPVLQTECIESVHIALPLGIVINIQLTGYKHGLLLIEIILYCGCYI